jgi:hypothetical protein
MESCVARTFRVLIPMFGRLPLDAIKREDVQPKAQLEVKSPKMVNNILAVLSILLKKAVEWDVIERMPCRIKLLPIEKGASAFHDFEEYERHGRTPLTRQIVQNRMRLAAKRVHILRRTFCLHLSMRGAPARTDPSAR